jgi:Ca2+-binding RTX toxin-like protein
LLIGNDGNDTFMGGGGNDTLVGGNGVDTADYGASNSGVRVELWRGLVSADGRGAADTMSGIENAVGSAFADFLVGTEGANLLIGHDGNDTLLGGGGSDTLLGGAGDDTFDAGAGNDTIVGGTAGVDVFVFTSAAGAANADQLEMFESGRDRLVFEDAVFSAIGPAGSFGAGDGRFHAAAGATSGQDANDRLIYNTQTGNLYYDPDGSGAAQAQLVATIAGAPSLLASDISVF